MPVYLVYHSGEGIQNRGEGYETAAKQRTQGAWRPVWLLFCIHFCADWREKNNKKSGQFKKFMLQYLLRVI